MGATRKLMAEIDRTLKKVQEGIGEFDQIWDKVNNSRFSHSYLINNGDDADLHVKVYDTDSQSQREKYEADLKKEIKKLQRLRDQIKTWINGSDIKDKAHLMEARKNIEKKMEQFKSCEKEAKTKAFSKAGLGQAAKLDPEEKARQATREWLNEQVESLQMQIDEYEAKLESLNGSKKGKKPAERPESLQERVSQHRSHISRLEQCMRCLDNGTVTYQEIDDLRDIVEYYVSENGEDAVDYISVDEIYGAVLDRLDDVTLGLQGMNSTTKIKKLKEAEEELAEREREKERAAAAAVKAQLASHGSNVSTALVEEEKKIARTNSIVTTNSTTGLIPPTSTTATTTSPVQTNSSATGAVQDQQVTLSVSSGSNHIAAVSSPEEIEVGNENISQSRGSSNLSLITASGGKTVENQTTGTASNGSVSFASAAAGRVPPVQNVAVQRQVSLNQTSKGEDGDFPKLPTSTILGNNAEKAKSLDLQSDVKSSLKRTSLDTLTVQKSNLSDSSNVSQSQQGSENTSIIPSNTSLLANHIRSQASSSSKGPSQESTQNGVLDSSSGLINHTNETTEDAEVDPMLSMMSLTQLISTLSMPCTDVKGVTVSPGQFEGNAVASLQLLQACNRGAMPQPIDSDYKGNLSQNTVRSISHQLPASYPIQRLPQLEDPQFYQQLDREGLFYAFYFHPGDILQHCAATELKRQSWRYHIEHKSWFRRSGDPNSTNEDYEEGSYIYFDRVLLNNSQQQPGVGTTGESSSDLNGWCYRRKDNFTFRYDQLEEGSH